MQLKCKCKCQYGVLTWLHGKDKYWHGFNVNEVSMWLHDECWHDFEANEVLTKLHGKDECWHDFSVNEVLMWLYGKNECWHGFGANEVLTWLHGNDKYWPGFNTNKVWRQLLWKKKSAITASLQRQMMVRLHSRCKCKCYFSRQINSDTSMQMQVLAQFLDKDKWWHDFDAKKNMDAASLWRQVLIWLPYKNKCWHSFMAKTLDVAMFQRLLMWLHCKDKCWFNLIAKTKASTTSRSSTSNNIIVPWILVITLLPRWLPLWECQGWILLRDCYCKARMW